MQKTKNETIPVKRHDYSQIRLLSRRRLFAAGILLLLCVTSIALWVCSYWRRDSVERQYTSQTTVTGWVLANARGSICLTRFCRPNVFASTYPSQQFYVRTAPPTLPSPDWTVINRLGFHFKRLHGTLDPGSTSSKVEVWNWSICIPHWIFVGSAIVPLCLFAVKMKRSARRGFDLRASPVRCTQCGTAVTKERPAPDSSDAASSE